VALRAAALWRKVLALVPVLLVVVASASAPVQLRCRMSGEVRSACCCPSGEAPAGPALSDPCCCDRVLITHAPAPLASERPAVSVALATPVALPAFAVLVTPDPTSAPHVVRRGGPLRSGSALLVLKQTFLL
jgi:hypothetical protein